MRSRLGFLFVSLSMAACASSVPQKTTDQPAPASPSNDSGLPSATSLLDAHLNAIGGRERLLAVQNYVATGRMIVEAEGFEAEVEQIAIAPNRVLTRVQMPDIAPREEGFDGEIAWSLDPMTGPRIKRGAELAFVKRTADLHASANFRQHYKEMETLELTEFNERECFKVRLVTQDAREELAYFAAEGGLHMGGERQTPTADGDVLTVIKVLEYKRFGEILQPAVVEQTAGVNTGRMIVSDMQVNVADVPTIEVPDEIRTLARELAEDEDSAE